MSYTDLTNEYSTRHLDEWQTLEQLAQNDFYNRLPNGTATLFFQTAAPVKWTKSATNNDKVLRVVSGAGGGGGGTLALSTGFTLAHSHTVNSHTHDSVAHQHILHVSSTLGQPESGTDGVSSTDSDGSILNYHRGPNVGSPNYRIHRAQTLSDGGGITAGAAAPSTDSQLATQTFSYFDAIVCVKD